MRRALITGIGGQDGSLLAELLLAEGYAVTGIGRRQAAAYPNLGAIRERVVVVQADLTDVAVMERLLREIEPDEVYNFASASFVPASWDDPVASISSDAVGATALLEAVRQVSLEIRVCQAASSEIFGIPARAPQNEETPVAPVSPYGVGKACAHHVTRSYRLRYGLHASTAILYNHESPRRPAAFLPRKVSLGVAAIANGMQRELVLGDLDARRDWGYAGDYVRAAWLMLQQEEPTDFVIATGTTYSVRDLVERAFSVVGLDYRDYVRTDPGLVRGGNDRADVVGDASRARELLDWRPEMSFDDLVRLLVEADLGRAA